MSHVRTKYIVYNHGGTGVRHHHFSSSNYITGQSDDNYPGATNASPGTHTANGWQTLPYMGGNVQFAFMSVHSAADGNHLYTTYGDQNVQVGDADIDIVVVYAPLGGIGGPGGGPGIWVDAFNVDLGDFSDDINFIKILNPPPPGVLDGGQTFEANQEGDVSSNSQELIQASDTVTDGMNANVPFLEWKKIFPTESILNSSEFTLNPLETGEIWIAFYQTVPPNVSIIKIKNILAQTMGRWVADDTCGSTGPHHWGPIGPVGPFAFQISISPAEMKKLNKNQIAAIEKLNKEYSSVASAAVNAVEKANAILNEAGKVLSEGK